MAQDMTADRYRKATARTKPDKLSEALTQMNMQNQARVDENFKRNVYALATGFLGNSTRGRDDKGVSGNTEAGKFGDDYDKWGVRMNEQLTFFNPAIDFEKPVQNQSQFEPLETEEFDVPVTELDKIMGKRDITKEIPIPNLSSFTNFDLGKGVKDYDEFEKSMSPEQRKEWEDFLTAASDPEVMKQIGSFNFETGTDATPFEEDGDNKFRVGYANLMKDPEILSWAYSQGMDPSNWKPEDYQVLLGRERYNTIYSFAKEAAKRRGITLPDNLFAPYTKNNHTLGKNIKDPKERYSRVTSTNKAEKITKKIGEEEYDTGERNERVTGRRKGIINKKTGKVIHSWDE